MLVDLYQGSQPLGTPEDGKCHTYCRSVLLLDPRVIRNRPDNFGTEATTMLDCDSVMSLSH
jgi:hypothetical protein